mgnify:CR=1 FL=1
MKWIPAALLLALASSPAHAALSGFYDSAEQIGTILSSETVAKALRQAPIGHVANTGTREDGAHEWQITTQECDLTVYLIPVPPKGVGKITYDLEVGNACQ